MSADRVSGSIPEIAESFSLYTPLKSQKFAEIDGLMGVLRWNSGEQKHQNIYIYIYIYSSAGTDHPRSRKVHIWS